MITRLSRTKVASTLKSVKQKIKKRDVLVSGGVAIVLESEGYCSHSGYMRGMHTVSRVWKPGI
jgi:hypothetical protein